MLGCVGVVIPSYRNAPYVGIAVASVIAQTRADLRLVVIVDGSPDDDAAVARAAAGDDPRVTVVEIPNGGVGAARNAGAARLRDQVDALLFLDADDALRPTALADLADGLVPGAAGAYGAQLQVDCHGVPLEQETVSLSHTRANGSTDPRTVSVGLAELALHNPIWCPGALLVDAGAFFAVEGFDPQIQLVEDYELWLRLSRRGPLMAVHRTVVDYRRHADSATATREQTTYASLRHVRALMYARPDLTPAERRVLRRAWRVHNTIRATQALGRSEALPKRLVRAGAHLALAGIGRPVDLSRGRR